MVMASANAYAAQVGATYTDYSLMRNNFQFSRVVNGLSPQEKELSDRRIGEVSQAGFRVKTPAFCVFEAWHALR